MIKSTYSLSPYGKMRDRKTEIRKEAEAKRKRKEENYYVWLVTGNR